MPIDAVWDDELSHGSLRDLTDEHLARFRARAVPQPGQTVRGPVPLHDDARLGVPSTIVCTAFSPDDHRAHAEQGVPFLARLLEHRALTLVDLVDSAASNAEWSLLAACRRSRPHGSTTSWAVSSSGAGARSGTEAAGDAQEALDVGVGLLGVERAERRSQVDPVGEQHDRVRELSVAETCRDRGGVGVVEHIVSGDDNEK